MFSFCDSDMFLEVEAGTMAPDAEVTEVSNWNTSVHIPALSIGPANSEGW